MSDQSDHLSTEVSAEVSISKKVDGIAASAKTKSRAVAALDRLVGGIMDVPAAYLDGKAAKIRAKNAVEIDITNADGKAALAALYNDPDFGARTAERFALDQARKQINRETVAAKTIEHLEEGDDPGAPEGDLDDDWLNLFEVEAEKATSDRLRDLWGRVLAGEIRKPGSFSLSTLRFISELDAQIAETFQRAVTLRLTSGEIIKPKELSNQPLFDLIALEAAGLLQGVHGSMGKPLQKDSDDSFNFFMPNSDVFLRFKTDKKSWRLEVIYITRTGREILSILPSPSDIETLTAIGEYFLDSVEEATINHIVKRRTDGKVHFVTIKKLK